MTQPHTKRFLWSVPAEAVSATVAPPKVGSESHNLINDSCFAPVLSSFEVAHSAAKACGNSHFSAMREMRL